MSPVPPATSSRRSPGRGREPVEQRLLPEAVDAGAHQVVHQVVAAGDAVEHAADQAGLRGGVDLGVAEGARQTLRGIGPRRPCGIALAHPDWPVGAVMAARCRSGAGPQQARGPAVRDGVAGAAGGRDHRARLARAADRASRDGRGAAAGRHPLPAAGGPRRRRWSGGVAGFGRRAKYILGELEPDRTLLLHLGMSGRLLFDGEARGPHEHVTLSFDDGTTLRFVDPRRFGMLDLCEPPASRPTAGSATSASSRSTPASTARRCWVRFPAGAPRSRWR